MWALRRASVHLRNRRLISSWSSRFFGAKPDPSTGFSDYTNQAIIRAQAKSSDGFLSSTRFFSASSGEIHTLTEDNGLTEDENDDDCGGDIYEEKAVADDIQNELEEVGSVVKKKARRTSASLGMTKAILSSPTTSSVSSVLDKWVEEGNEVTQDGAGITITNLRKRRMFGKALELSEWLESKKYFEPDASSYASRVDLISKVGGIYKAEHYIKEIPESFRGELVYRTLLANCVAATNVRKSEEVFNRMKNMGFPVSCFSCNQLLLLYKRTDKAKIADVLVLMEKENIKPSVFTYQVLIDVKGLSKDITGMEQVLERMKAEGLEPNTHIQASMARYYAASGIKDKALSLVKEIEGEDLKKNRWACQWIIPVYASLGREDEVERIWKVCEEEEPRQIECLSAIEAWGKLNRIEEAELAFEKMIEKVKKPSSKHFNSLLKVYANHKQLAKGKELVRRMGESGCGLGPLSWDAIVRLYLGGGEVEKADSILGKAIGQKRGRPLFDTYIGIMEEYAGRRGDVHNAEKVFVMMRRAGYGTRLRQYQTLLEAYVKAGKVVYGFVERMKADNVFPNRVVAGQLAKADPFRKSADLQE